MKYSRGQSERGEMHVHKRGAETAIPVMSENGLAHHSVAKKQHEGTEIELETEVDG